MLYEVAAKICCLQIKKKKQQQQLQKNTHNRLSGKCIGAGWILNLLDIGPPGAGLDTTVTETDIIIPR